MFLEREVDTLRDYGATGLQGYGATGLRGYGATELRGYGATWLRRDCETNLTTICKTIFGIDFVIYSQKILTCLSTRTLAAN